MKKKIESNVCFFCSTFLYFILTILKGFLHTFGIHILYRVSDYFAVFYVCIYNILVVSSVLYINRLLKHFVYLFLFPFYLSVYIYMVFFFIPFIGINTYNKRTWIYGNVSTSGAHAQQGFYANLYIYIYIAAKLYETICRKQFIILLDKG